MWVLTTLLSYVLNIWLNASLGNTAGVFRAWDRPRLCSSALRANPAAVAARSAGSRPPPRLVPLLPPALRRRGRLTNRAVWGGKAAGFSPAQPRGLRNAFGAPPQTLPCATTPQCGRGAALGPPHCLSRAGACAGDQRENNGVLNIC